MAQECFHDIWARYSLPNIIIIFNLFMVRSIWFHIVDIDGMVDHNYS
jgi:hypothetical protein